jgi:hypothetical protein
MTNRVDQLERAGLVVRTPDPQDRRGLLVELTPQGLDTVDDLVAGHAALGQRLVSALPIDERECLVQGLHHLILTLEETTRGSEALPTGAADLIKPYMREPRADASKADSKEE